MTPNVMPKLLLQLSLCFLALLSLSQLLSAEYLSQAFAKARARNSNIQVPVQRFTAKCIGVSDGDTIVILKVNVPTKVRLAGIDCPEKKQDFGLRAKQFTSDLVFGKDVVVEMHGHDRYGRMIAEVFTPSGESLNKALLQNGFAWWYRQYSKEPELQALEKQAKENKLGLWKSRDQQPPWLFRKTIK